jgi:hypothetical protein
LPRVEGAAFDQGLVGPGGRAYPCLFHVLAFRLTHSRKYFCLSLLGEVTLSAGFHVATTRRGHKKGTVISDPALLFDN